MMELTIDKMIPVYEKMLYDTNYRMSDTISIFRACRLFNYNFVAKTNILALRNEFIHIHHIPLASLKHMPDLLAEVSLYKELSDAEITKEVLERIPLWDFWLTHALELPNLFEIVSEAALISPSSASVERLFSLLTKCFGDCQERALEDYKAAVVILRYNTRKRNNEYEAEA